MAGIAAGATRIGLGWLGKQGAKYATKGSARKVAEGIFTSGAKAKTATKDAGRTLSTSLKRGLGSGGRKTLRGVGAGAGRTLGFLNRTKGTAAMLALFGGLPLYQALTGGDAEGRAADLALLNRPIGQDDELSSLLRQEQLLRDQLDADRYEEPGPTVGMAALEETAVMAQLSELLSVDDVSRISQAARMGRPTITEIAAQLGIF